jgi:hypothetical protein
MKNKVLFGLLLAVVGNLPTTARALDPTAHAMLTNVTTAGDTLYSFTVRYSDDGPLTDSFSDHDVRVNGPNGFDVPAKFVGENPNNSGSVIVVTYSIIPPGGNWDSGDNGTYTAVMQPDQVTDSLGNPVKAGSIGSFTVTAPEGAPTPTPSPSGSPTLANVSTRLRVEIGDNVLIGGFIVTGTQAKKVIIRALGPSTPVSGALVDPFLELYSGSTLLEANDNWVDSPNKQAIIDSTIPPANSLESAIVRTLNPGAYTAVVRGVNNGTGIGVVEAYDLDRTVDSKLANISTRGLVQTGDNVLIGGFIVLGSGSQKVIIRALGPSVPVSGAMADPTLELHDGNGSLLEANDNWMDSSNKQAIIDSTIPPMNSLEAAIVRALAPGNYTAVVRGANNTTGIALVEVYALN